MDLLVPRVGSMGYRIFFTRTSSYHQILGGGNSNSFNIFPLGKMIQIWRLRIFFKWGCSPTSYMVFDMTFLGRHRSSKRSLHLPSDGRGQLVSPRRADSFALGICNGHLAKKTGTLNSEVLLFSSSLKDSNLIHFWSYVQNRTHWTEGAYIFSRFFCRGCYHHYYYHYCYY